MRTNSSWLELLTPDLSPRSSLVDNDYHSFDCSLNLEFVGFIHTQQTKALKHSVVVLF